MMRRIGLAVLLGIALGLGLAVIPESGVTHDRALMEAKPAATSFKQGPAETTGGENYQPILIGLVAGIALGIPAFAIAKRRGR